MSSFPEDPAQQRVRLREVRDDDMDFLRALRNDVDVQRAAMAHAKGSTAADVRAWLARRAEEGAVLLVVAEAESDRALGYAQLTGIAREQGRAWLGVCLARPHQRRGLGGAAVGLLEARARALGLRKILLEVLATNLAALRLYRRMGYREVGTLQGHFRMPGEAPEDAVLMEKLL